MDIFAPKMPVGIEGGIVNQCICCNRKITSSFWVCAKCEEKYGLKGSWANWPQWAKALYDSKRAERRDDIRYSRMTEYDDEVDLSELSLSSALELVQEGELDPQDVADCDPIWAEYDA